MKKRKQKPDGTAESSGPDASASACAMPRDGNANTAASAADTEIPPAGAKPQSGNAARSGRIFLCHSCNRVLPIELRHHEYCCNYCAHVPGFYDKERIEQSIGRAIERCSFSSSHYYGREKTDRNANYSCYYCNKAFKMEEFPLLPVIKGNLVCRSCYGRESAAALQDDPYCCGQLVDLIDTKGIDGYALSHGALLTIRAVAFNETVGYFNLEQSICDAGEDYITAPIRNGKESASVKDIVTKPTNNRHCGIFHPLLLFLQYYNVDDPSFSFLQILRKSPLRKALPGKSKTR